MGPRWAASMSAKLRVRTVKNCRIMLLSVGLSEKKTVDLNGGMKHPVVVEGSCASFLCFGLADAAALPVAEAKFQSLRHSFVGAFVLPTRNGPLLLAHCHGAP